VERALARVPITIMGLRCDRCGHEWIPRAGIEDEPRVCPKCHSPYWNQPRKKARMTYEAFRDKIVGALMPAGKPLTWTEVRTVAGLPQLFPNNQWVHRLEKDAGLIRRRESDGIIHWLLKDSTVGEPPTKAAGKISPRPRRE
jgi:hypothetical protein